MSRLTALVAAAACLGLSACVAIPVRDVFDAPPPPPSDGPLLPPISALPPAEYIGVRLTDGSPGLALWCEVRGDCIEAARILCSNRQSIRADADIDRSGPGAAEFFARSTGAAHTLTVSCPVGTA